MYRESLWLIHSTKREVCKPRERIPRTRRLSKKPIWANDKKYETYGTSLYQGRLKKSLKNSVEQAFTSHSCQTSARRITRPHSLILLFVRLLTEYIRTSNVFLLLNFPMTGHRKKGCKQGVMVLRPKMRSLATMTAETLESHSFEKPCRYSLNCGLKR